MNTNGNQRGFSLIELLVVLVVISVLTAIMIPNLLNAINRGKQKRSMADIRSIATAVETYAVDNHSYPVASDIATLTPLIQPVFIRSVPGQDGWGRSFIIDATAARYTVGSGGRDGGGLVFIGGPTTDLDDAIILVNGSFVQWPAGTQQ